VGLGAVTCSCATATADATLTVTRGGKAIATVRATGIDGANRLTLRR
jgi:hypothetical protein